MFRYPSGCLSAYLHNLGAQLARIHALDLVLHRLSLNVLVVVVPTPTRLSTKVVHCLRTALGSSLT